MDMRSAVEAADRVALAHLPTPLEPMRRLSAHLGGPRLWVKRDDLTGVGLGGNKVRKLEYVLPDALASEADVLVTSGVAQSNSVRQISAAAARVGLGCVVVEFTERTDAAPPPGPRGGNAMLIRLFGATIRPTVWTGDRTGAIGAVAAELTAAGRRPYVVPYGVSNALGALGYVRAGYELLDQGTDRGFAPRAVVHASGSGGTQAGLVAGLYESGVSVLGVDVDAEPDRIRADVARIAGGIADHHGLDARAVDDAIQVVGGYAGPEYGAVTDETVEAIDLAARLEGLALDPVYSAKALAAVVGMVRRARFAPDDDVVFVHTGGAPSLLATPQIGELVERRRRGAQ